MEILHNVKRFIKYIYLTFKWLRKSMPWIWRNVPFDKSDVIYEFCAQELIDFIENGSIDIVDWEGTAEVTACSNPMNEWQRAYFLCKYMIPKYTKVTEGIYQKISKDILFPGSQTDSIRKILQRVLRIEERIESYKNIVCVTVASSRVRMWT